MCDSLGHDSGWLSVGCLAPSPLVSKCQMGARQDSCWVGEVRVILWELDCLPLQKADWSLRGHEYMSGADTDRGGADTDRGGANIDRLC